MSVIEVQFSKGHVGRLAEDIKNLILQHDGRVGLAEVLGVLELIKIDLIDAARGEK